jgi:hypothetical protein
MEGNFEDKQLTVLRRKFLVGIPTFSVVGYALARMTSAKFSLGRWAGRGLHVIGAVVTPILGSMLIVHFNRAEIFRLGIGMMRQMEEMRKSEDGPFADPMMRQRWDQQMQNRQFKILKPDENIANEFKSSLDFERIVEDSIRK